MKKMNDRVLGFGVIGILTFVFLICFSSGTWASVCGYSSVGGSEDYWDQSYQIVSYLGTITADNVVINNLSFYCSNSAVLKAIIYNGSTAYPDHVLYI